MKVKIKCSKCGIELKEGTSTIATSIPPIFSTHYYCPECDCGIIVSKQDDIFENRPKPFDSDLVISQ